MNDGSREISEDAQIKSMAHILWTCVFEVSNTIAFHAKQYGFVGMDMPEPNIHEIIIAMRVLEGVLEPILNDERIQYDEKRLLLNAKEQITRLDRLALALQNNNRSDFNEALECLNKQAMF